MYKIPCTGRTAVAETPTGFIHNKAHKRRFEKFNFTIPLTLTHPDLQIEESSNNETAVSLGSNNVQPQLGESQHPSLSSRVLLGDKQSKKTNVVCMNTSEPSIQNDDVLLSNLSLYLNLNDVLRLLNISKSTWYRGIASGVFPKPRKITGARISRWFKYDIINLIVATNREGGV